MVYCSISPRRASYFFHMLIKRSGAEISEFIKMISGIFGPDPWWYSTTVYSSSAHPNIVQMMIKLVVAIAKPLKLSPHDRQQRRTHKFSGSMVLAQQSNTQLDLLRASVRVFLSTATTYSTEMCPSKFMFVFDQNRYSKIWNYADFAWMLTCTLQ